jgi:hypothetical protein
VSLKAFDRRVRGGLAKIAEKIAQKYMRSKPSLRSLGLALTFFHRKKTLGFS